MTDIMPATLAGEATVASRRYFVVVCPVERRAHYERAFFDSSHDAVIVHDITELLTCCIDEPPLAVILDMVAVTQAGSLELAPIFELRMGWPVIRCNVLPDGSLNALCVDPPQHGPLREMLDCIAAADPAWQRKPSLSRHQRRHLRLPIKCRARLRIHGGDDWRQGNTLDLSAGGAFVVSYEAFALEAKLDFELWDLLPQPCLMRGRVVSVRLWEEGAELPGVAVQFDPATVSAAFKKALARSARLAELA